MSRIFARTAVVFSLLTAVLLVGGLGAPQLVILAILPAIAAGISAALAWITKPA